MNTNNLLIFWRISSSGTIRVHSRPFAVLKPIGYDIVCFYFAA